MNLMTKLRQKHPQVYYNILRKSQTLRARKTLQLAGMNLLVTAFGCLGGIRIKAKNTQLSRHLILMLMENRKARKQPIIREI